MAAKKESGPELIIDAKLTGVDDWKEWCKGKGYKVKSNNSNDAIYFFGMVGSLIYWFQAANDFGAYFTAILKSLVWPAYVVYKLLEMFYGFAG